jgi:TonB family protein
VVSRTLLAAAVAVALAACSNAEPEAARIAPTPIAQPAMKTTPPPSPRGSTSASPSADANEPARDPFAGVDPTQNDVLRNIARLDPGAATKAGVRPAAAPTVVTNVPASATTDSAVADPRLEGATTAAPNTTDESKDAPDQVVQQAAPDPIDASTPAAPRPENTPAPGVAPEPSSPSHTETGPEPAAVAPATEPAAAFPRRAIAKPDPEFPREALRDGINEGRVLARLAISADGHVTEVTVLSATPSRSFGRAAERALRNWHYEPAVAPSSTQVELVFRAE